MNKSIIFFIILCVTAACTQTSRPIKTADSIIEAYKKSAGDSGKMDSIKSLHFEIEFPGHDYLVIVDVQRPDKIRTSGGDKYILVFDGKRAAYLKGAPSESGQETGSRLLPKNEWKDFEVDRAWYLPAFLDYPATLAGMDTVNSIPVYQLKTTLPLGAKMTYYLDTRNYRIRKISAEVEMDGKTYFPHREYSNYRTVNGFAVADSFTYSYTEETGPTAVVKAVSINNDYLADFFKIPLN